MEMCAHLLANGMLQPEQVGTQGVNGDVVAYYEALPNEAVQNQKVRFDAGGSHTIVQANPRSVSDAELEYTWDFGDGTTATGQVVEHAYPEARPEPYASVLTVRNTRTGASRRGVL